MVRRLVPRGRLLLRDQSHLSFFIIVIFFAVYSIFMLTKILLQVKSKVTSMNQPKLLVSSHHQPSLMMSSSIVKTMITAQPSATVCNPEKDTKDWIPGIGNTTAAQDGVWQPVGGTRYKFFVFSAYYDFREERVVRVIGTTKTYSNQRVWCRLWYHKAGISTHSISVAATIKAIRENWDMEYSACFILCPLNGIASVPSSVSIVSELTMYPQNRLIVHRMQRNGKVPPRRKMAACIKPLHYNYSKSLSMVEFIELNRLQGIEHFYFYNDTVSSSTSCVLDSYGANRRVTVLPWRLDLVSQKEIRTEGMFAALNDCLYRTMYSYSHVAFIDLDEFIMPQHNETLFQLIDPEDRQTVSQLYARQQHAISPPMPVANKATPPPIGERSMSMCRHLNQDTNLECLLVEKKQSNTAQLSVDIGKRNNLRNVASFSVRNAFFYLQWSDDATLAGSEPFQSNMVTLRKTRRRWKLHPHMERSKYICRPEYVMEVGNHFVWEFLTNYSSLNVNSEMAILNHYRVCEFGGDDCVNSASVVDRTALRYRDQLVVTVRERWNSFKSECNLPEVTSKPVTLFTTMYNAVSPPAS